MKADERRVALVTGGASGLGLRIAALLGAANYQVIVVGRDTQRLETALNQLRESLPTSASGTDDAVTGLVADVTCDADVSRLFSEVQQRFGRLDVLVNCVGTSDRGLIEKLEADRLRELIEQNVVSALLCSQAALALLESRGGVIVNIGSLAAKVGARYLGGYAVAKHALAGMTQQLRLELRPRGIHVALVSPGPIRREDSANRYASRIDASLPAQAAAPGGGTRVKGLDPDVVARAVLRCVEQRLPDVVLPRHLRLLIAIGHLCPRLGDWLLVKFTSSKTQ